MNTFFILFWLAWLVVGLASSLSIFTWHIYKKKLFYKITENTHIVVDNWLFYSLIKDKPGIIFLMDVFAGYVFSFIFLFVLIYLVIILY